MWKLLYLNWLEWESVCWWVWLEGSEVHLVRNLLGDHEPATLTLCVTLKKKRGKFVEFPVCVVRLKRKLYWPNTPIVSSGSERCLVVSEGWLNQTFPPPPHPSSSQNSPFVSYSNRDDFPPFLFSRPISVRRVALSFCTSSPGPAVSQSLYPLSPGVASPRRLGHVLFCLAQVSHIPDIIGRTPVSLADSHLERGGQSLSRQWRTVPSVSGPKHTNKRTPSHQVWPGRDNGDILLNQVI